MYNSREILKGKKINRFEVFKYFIHRRSISRYLYTYIYRYYYIMAQLFI